MVLFLTVSVLRKHDARKRSMMSGNDKNDVKQKKVLSFKGGKKQQESKAKAKPRVTVGWILGMAVLLIIGASFIIGPTLGAVLGKRNQGNLVFGTYGKEDISYAYNNYFFDQVQHYADQYKGSQNDPTQTLYQIWKSAYDSTVVYTAVGQLAKQAGIQVNTDVLNRAIIDSGAYHKDGTFDVDTYQKATTERKSAIESSIRRNLPYRMVMTDVSTVLASEAEREYVGNMASKVRDFSYLLFDSSLYPDSEAIAYALEHKQLFENIELSIISLGSLEDAEEVASSLQSGLYTFEEAAREHSLDMYAQADGYIGTIPFFAIKPNFRYEDEAAALLGAASGSIVGPFETGGGWAIYRVSTAAEEADVADENTRNLVKAYIGSNEEELMDSYLSNLVTEVSEYAKKTGLVEAALEYDLDLVEVMPTGYNVGKSSFLNNFSYTDPTGMLASYATAEVQTELFTSAEHTLLEPMKTGGAYLLIEVGEDSTDEGMGSYTMMFYDYLAGSQSQENLAQTLYASDLHKDNFLTTFLRVVLGQ